MDSEDTVKEFAGGDSITLKMQLTPEQHSMMREWSLSIPTLYLLDICVVSATKLPSTSLERNPRKANVVKYLRELDRPSNCFSYLFALMEKVSDSRGIDTDEELERKILSDLTAMRDFFKNARVYESNEFVLEFLRALRGNPIEEKRHNYLGFLRVLNDQFKLGNPVSSKQRLNTAKNILEQTNRFNFSRQHPIAAIGLACLYGNPAANKLMKFKADPQNFDAENALADIMLITRFAGIKLEIEQLGRNGAGAYLRSNFITDDNGLIEIIKCFTPNVVKHVDKQNGREIQTTMTVKLKELLTDIQTEEYENLLNLLNQS
ncbi:MULTISPECIES: hypothetical protein [unclassified Pseudomonas]|uniref:hypothetical protein n=1 Tax=unclassified Pseudomonas TaxID=196821 RepID=UPI002579A0B7|nr:MULTISPECIES: hypothetical protein [unclassified Pseudomonas]